MGRPLEKAVFQPLDVKFILQVTFGGDQYRIMVLQKLQYLNQDGGIVAQTGEIPHKHSADESALHRLHHLF